MDDELRHRLARYLYEHGSEPTLEWGEIVSHTDDGAVAFADAVLAEIGKTHVLIAVNDPRIQWADTIDISGIMDETRHNRAGHT